MLKYNWEDYVQYKFDFSYVLKRSHKEKILFFFYFAIYFVFFITNISLKKEKNREKKKHVSKGFTRNILGTPLQCSVQFTVFQRRYLLLIFFFYLSFYIWNTIF